MTKSLSGLTHFVILSSAQLSFEGATEEEAETEVTPDAKPDTQTFKS